MRQLLHTYVRRFAADTSGTTLVELAIVIPTLLLLVLGTIEIGRLGYTAAMAQKATELAVRTAAVRPAVCADVPQTIEPVIVDASEDPPRFGTLCRGNNACAAPATPEAICTLAENNTSADEIWQTIAPLLPPTATRANVQMRYTFDPDLGFLGGPYTPIVTVELVDFEFRFITPLGDLADLATGGPASEIPRAITFPNMSASLPAEDLDQGTGL